MKTDLLRAVLSLISNTLVLLMMFSLAACVAGGRDLQLRGAGDPFAETGADPVPQPAIAGQKTRVSSGGIADARKPSAFATENNSLEPVFRPRVKKTYLINGLASNVEFIGYGFRNLSRKIPGSQLHSYASFVESSTLIRSNVTKEIKRAYAQNPNIEINLIGISFGANIVTLIAADLDRKNIPVHYLATMEGPAMVSIRDNVKVADNFSCTNLDCFRTKSRLARGNRATRHSSFRIKSSHIPLADNARVHRRILSQINRPNFYVQN